MNGPHAQQPSNAVPTTTYEATQEIRFAVVMYGGVSLAIYINGVVQELLQLVRATAPATSTGRDANQTLLTDKDLTGTAAVYRDLGRMLRFNEEPVREGDPGWDDGSIKTRFVVDIISGSSAGGINGVYLAKALVRGQSVERLKRLWVDEGDIALLINDGQSVDGLDGLTLQDPPSSLLNSQRMYWKLLSALDAMDAETPLFPGEEHSTFVEELDLWITTTDLQGLLLPIDLYDRIVYELRHRNVFHFVYGTDDSRGDDQDDFHRKNNPFLAYAARATASFPFAFEPMRLDDIDAVLGTDAFAWYSGAEGRVDAKEWRAFFPDYAPDTPPPGQPMPSKPADPAALYRGRSFSDGGILDNKPFTHATETLKRRRADVPVDRRLLYIEPDPSGPRAVLKGHPDGAAPPQPDVADRPHALEVAQVALTGLPRNETIREDLERLLARNREIAAVEELTRIVDPVLAERPANISTTVPREEWLRQTSEELLKGRELGYRAYHELKVTGVLTDIATTLARLMRIDEHSDDFSGLRCFVDAWFEEYYEQGGEATEDKRTQTKFLLDFNLSYRLRRASFLQERINHLLRADENADAMVQHMPGLETESPVRGWPKAERDGWADALYAAKRELNQVVVDLRKAARDARNHERHSELVATLNTLEIWPHLRSVLEGAKSRRESVSRARDLLLRENRLDGLDKVIDNTAAITREAVVKTGSETSEMLDGVRPTPPPTLDPAAAEGKRRALAILRHLYDHYENYDAVILPLSYGRLGEAAQVEVVRISPEDATSLINESDPTDARRKLAGTAVGHFGGFLDRNWRKNDLLWGRLDTAERLIDTLLPRDAAWKSVRDQLLVRAQEAIIEEEFDLKNRSELTALLVDGLMRTDAPSEGASLDEQAKTKQQNAAAIRALLARSDDATLRSALTSANDASVIRKYLHEGYEVSRELDPYAALAAAARTSRVTGEVLDGIGASALKWPTRWLMRFARVLWAVSEATLPRSLSQLIVRYWLQLLMLTGIVMIVGGTLFGQPNITQSGWTTLGVAIGIRLLLFVAEDLLGRRLRWLPALGRRLWRRIVALWQKTGGQLIRRRRTRRALRLPAGSATLAILGAAVLALVGLAVLEGVLHIGDDVRSAWDWLRGSF